MDAKDKTTNTCGAYMTVDAVIACGGSSSRMGRNKLLADIGGVSCIRRTCMAFDSVTAINKIIISAPQEHRKEYECAIGQLNKEIVFVQSGASRQESVINAVKKSDADIVVVHDGARPLVSSETIEKSICDAKKYGSSVTCVPAKDTIRYDDGEKSYVPDRSDLYIVQTPQSFLRQVYLKAAQEAVMHEKDYTDDAQLVEAIGVKPHITMGEYSNIKLTTSEDLACAEALLDSMHGRTPRSCMPRIGHGYDVHRFSADRKLVLGGVQIPYEMGLLGHSDADVLTHALMDALLGAAALGDIGGMFPDSDARFEGISSIVLLKEVMKALRSNGYELQNCDVTVIAQRPKLMPYIQQMRQTLSNAMGVDTTRVSVKATTEEGLGFTGRGEGIAAHAVAIIY